MRKRKIRKEWMLFLAFFPSLFPWLFPWLLITYIFFLLGLPARPVIRTKIFGSWAHRTYASLIYKKKSVHCLTYASAN